MVRQLVALGIVVPTSDLLSIRRSIAYFIESITKQAAQQEAVGVIGEDLFAIALVRGGWGCGAEGEGLQCQPTSGGKCAEPPALCGPGGAPTPA